MLSPEAERKHLGERKKQQQQQQKHIRMKRR